VIALEGESENGDGPKFASFSRASRKRPFLSRKTPPPEESAFLRSLFMTGEGLWLVVLLYRRCRIELSGELYFWTALAFPTKFFC